MWNTRALRHLNVRLIAIVLALMGMSFLVLTSCSVGWDPDPWDATNDFHLVWSQVKWFSIGWALFFFFAGFDYNFLREWTWFLYAFTLLALVGLFFTSSIQNVHRWYRIPLIGLSFQPSEVAKLVVVIALSWMLERQMHKRRSLLTSLQLGLIALLPFLLILKQPDLGTALVLIPITLMIFYIGDVSPKLVRIAVFAFLLLLAIVAGFFSGLLPHEELRPYVTTLIRDYQYDRLQPNAHHHAASTTAIALGGLFGRGWLQGEYFRGGWLPAPATDSVFATFGEEFGIMGLGLMLALFYALIYFSFQVMAVAKDCFGRLLAAGISVYLTVHVLLNIGMMCGLLPITGVPLPLITYGGSSLLATMTALGILQSIYSRRLI